MATEIVRELVGGEWVTKVGTGGGGGGSQTVYVQQDDPGAVGAGMLWVEDTTPEVFVRTAADDGWLKVYPSEPPTLAEILSDDPDADGNPIANGGDFTMAEAIIEGSLNHDGSAVGFYGSAPVAKPTVSPIADPQTVTLPDLATAFNLLLDALATASLGLIDSS